MSVLSKRGRILFLLGGVLVGLMAILGISFRKGWARESFGGAPQTIPYCGDPIDVVFIVPEPVDLEAITQILLLDRSLTCQNSVPHVVGVLSWRHPELQEDEDNPVESYTAQTLTELVPFRSVREREGLWPLAVLQKNKLQSVSFNEKAFVASLQSAEKMLSAVHSEGQHQFIVYVGPAAFNKHQVPYPLAMQSRLEELGNTAIHPLRKRGITFLAYVYEGQRMPDYAQYTHKGWQDAIGEKALKFVAADHIEVGRVVSWLVEQWQNAGLLPAVVPEEGGRFVMPAGLSAVALTWAGHADASLIIDKQRVELPLTKTPAATEQCSTGEAAFPCQVVHTSEVQSIVVVSPPAGTWQAAAGNTIYLQWEAPTLHVTPSDNPLPQDRGQPIEDNATIEAHLWGRRGNVSAQNAHVDWHGDATPCGALQFSWDEVGKGWQAALCRQKAGEQTWKIEGSMDVSFGGVKHFSVPLAAQGKYDVFAVQLLQARVFVSTDPKSAKDVVLHTPEDAPLRVSVHRLDFSAWQWPFLFRQVAPLHVVVGMFDEQGKQIAAEQVTDSPDNFVRVRVRTPENTLSREVVLKYIPAFQWWEGDIPPVDSHAQGTYYLWVDVGKTAPQFYWKKSSAEGQEIVFRRIDSLWMWGAFWLLVVVTLLWSGHTYWCRGCSVLRYFPLLKWWARPWGYVEFYGTFHGKRLADPIGRLSVKCRHQRFDEEGLAAFPVLPYDEVGVKWGKEVEVTARYKQAKDGEPQRMERIPIGKESEVGVRGVVIRVVSPSRQKE